MMQESSSQENIKSFARLVDVLAPWLKQVVIIGGWAHRLYRLHPLAQPLDYEPLVTIDTDVAVPIALPHRREGIRERLVANGFREELFGDMRPPAIHYRLVAANTAFYAEFLTPLIGSANKGGKRDATASIGGISAQKLRHLELLLAAPWVVEIGPATGFLTLDTYQVQIPNPVAYLVQKILIFEPREPGDRAKDLLYMHDTIEVFGNALPELKTLWKETVQPLLSTRAVRAVESAPKKLFGEVSNAVREAAIMAAGRVSSPTQLLETCEVGLSAILS